MMSKRKENLKGNDTMCNLKEIFNEESFTARKLTEMIKSAISIYKEFIWKNPYIWVSLDTLLAEKGSLDITELKKLENGFIVEVITKESENIWDSVVRSFVNYINKNFNRDFKYNEWYEPELDENHDEVFTDDQLQSIYETCYEICVENRYESDPYFIIVDMESYKAVGVTKKLETLDEKFECILIEPLRNTYLSEIHDNCTHAIEKHFNITFEMTMFYEFEIYRF